MGYFPLPELKGKPNRIFVDGKTLNQIAKESGIRLDTVQHRYSRGVRDYEGLTKPSHIRVEHYHSKHSHNPTHYMAYLLFLS